MRCLYNLDSLTELVELRKRNLQLASREVDSADLSVYINLAGSIKKSTSFTKKLRTGAIHSQLDALITELSTLRLDKYLSEVVNAMTEAKMHSSKDLYACVKIGYMLHEKYIDFKDLITTALLKILNTLNTGTTGTAQQKKDREDLRLARQRVALRLLVEFYLAGIIVDPPKGSIISNVLQVLCMDEKNCLKNSTIIVTFVKIYGHLFFNVNNKTSSTAKVETSTPSNSPQCDCVSGHSPREDLEPYVDILLPPHVRNSVRGILQTYYGWIFSLFQREQKQIKQIRSSNYECYITMGEVTCERQAQYQKLSSSYERVVSVAKPLSKYLGFGELEGSLCQSSALGISTSQTDSNENINEKAPKPIIWDDEKSKTFYEDLIELKPVSSDCGNGQNSKKQHTHAVIDSSVPELKSKAPTLQKSQIDQLLPRLQEMVAAEDAGDLAISFMTQNTRFSRKKLIKALISVPKHRPDLLPLYARLIATLNQAIPNIGSEIVDVLESEFLKHVKAKSDEPLAEKVKNARYLGELVKFKIVPDHVALHCINRLLEDFRLLNVDLLCIFLETCGRFLYKSPSTSSRMTAILDILKRRKTAQNINHRQAIMIENAYYSCCSIDHLGVNSRKEAPLKLYIKHLVLFTLSKKTVEKTLKQLRKINWDDPDIVSYIKLCFLNTREFKFTDMDLIAYLIHKLMRYYPEFSVDVIDGIFEQIKVGLELNICKYNQQRISCVKLVGELYNYKIVQSSTIFDTLYTIICYGHEENIPRYMVSSPVDFINDFYRIRLCCTLLGTCGQYFVTGRASKCLECFMCFMHMYLHSKKKCPIDISIMIAEILESYCPKMKLFNSYIGYAENLIEILEEDGGELYPQLKNAVPILRSEINRIIFNNDLSQVSSIESDLTTIDDYTGECTSNQKNSKFVRSDVSLHNETASYNSASSIKKCSESLCATDLDAEELKEFDEEYNKLMKGEEQIPPLNPKSLHLVLPKNFTSKVYHKQGQEVSEKSDEVMFVMLAKKNNKQLILPLSFPKDVPFAAKSLSRVETEEEEKKQLKKLVLDYEQREMLNSENELSNSKSRNDNNKNVKITQKCAISVDSSNNTKSTTQQGDFSKPYTRWGQSDTVRKTPRNSRNR